MRYLGEHLHVIAVEIMLGLRVFEGGRGFEVERQDDKLKPSLVCLRFRANDD